MKKSLLKSTIREIKSSKARFLSIMAIIALGCGFYSGIKSTAPSMTEMANNYFERTNLMDYRILSTVGFDEKDIKALGKVSGVTDVEGGYFSDVFANYNDGVHQVRLIAVNHKLNTPVVTEGRLPNKKGEIAVEDGSFSGKTPNIGDTVSVKKSYEDLDFTETLNTFEYKVVGYIRSPMYISYERGTTNIGDGSLDTFMYVDNSNFKVERYTEVYVKTSYSNQDTVNSEYTESINGLKKAVKKTGKQRVEVFKTENVYEAEKTLAKKTKEYNDKKAKALQELDDAEKQLKEGKKEYKSQIAQAEKKISDGYIALENGKADYNLAKKKYNDEIAKAEKKIKDAETEYKKGLKEYNQGLKEYKSGKAEYDEKYEEFYNTTKPALEEKLDEAQKGLKQVQDAIDSLQSIIDSNPIMGIVFKDKVDELKEQKITINKGITAIEEGIKKGETELRKAEKKLKSANKKLVEAKNKLDLGKKEIDLGKQELNSSRLDGKKQLDDAYEKLKTSEAQLISGEKALEENKISGKKNLEDNEKKYKEAKKKANNKFNKAEQKLADAQEKLDSIKNPKWYVFTREDNPGYSAFAENTEKIDALAELFPMIFLLVAILVCLTTMTRLVDEKRTEIGTLKALGYSDTAIVSKFLIYSSLAGVVGGAVGIILGVNTLPFIIYGAYEMMYTMDPLILNVDYLSVVLGMILAILCTAVVAAIACYKTLKHRPSSLMRPKGPKAGKRVLLERITPLWSRLSFNSKVTARNIFRYKSRVLMTVIGIAGCTALLISAFGLKDSINAITTVQFKDVYKYNIVVAPQPNIDGKDLAKLQGEIERDKYVDSCTLFSVIEGDATKAQTTLEDKINIDIPQKLDEFSQAIGLQDRTTKQEITLNNDGVVISEKMAKMLDVKVGDSFTLTIDKISKEVKITGICEQYISHLLLMTPDFYRENYGEPDFNVFFVVHSGDFDAQSAFNNKMLKSDDIAAVTLMQTAINEFNDMLDSLNMVVFIMIICAGALAFVVLYNLTNINIIERVREIATIKVLGFNSREVSSFIYRENIVLAIVGILVGLILGTFLSNVIVSTIEMDDIMFGRSINILSYLLSIVLTSFFAFVVNFVMYFKMKKIDMVESLKSVE